MALRALMLNKSIKEKRDAIAELEKVDMQQREDELADAIETASTDEERSAVEEAVTAFEAEKADMNEKIETLRSEIAALETELSEIENAAPAETGTETEPVERKDEAKMEIRESREYINAYVDYIKTGDDAQVRSLLTTNAVSPQTGYVPVPVYVENRIRQAWENDELFQRVTRTYMKGNVKVGFELTAGNAAYHAEGAAAPTEETITLGIVEMIPKSIKKWITVSDEALDLGGEEFLDYIVDEIVYKITHFAAAQVVTLIAGASTTSSATATGQAKITAAPALGTVAEAIANLSDQARDPVIIMNKATWAAFKAVQYAGSYAVDPFEGLTVIFNSTLPAYSAASTGAVYMIVGDLRGVQANFPAGDGTRFTYDPYSLSEKDLMKIVGRMYVGLGVVQPFAFTNVAKPATT